MKLIASARRFVAAFVFAAALLLSPGAFAGDAADSPAIVNDPAADISDLYAFLDPNDNTQVVLIATIRTFIVPGQNVNLGVFDENLRYRFEIYSDHVNLTAPALDAPAAARRAYAAKVKPTHTIDVTFSKRLVGPDPQLNTSNNPMPVNLRRPKPQTATVNFGLFKDPAGGVLLGRGLYLKDLSGNPLVANTPSLASNAPVLTYQTIGLTSGLTAQFFAGLVEDPNFEDVPAISNFVDTIRNDAPSTSAFARGRDTFAGYNCLAIALRIPAVLLKEPAGGAKIGVDFLTQRHNSQLTTKDGFKGSGAFKTADRMGHPLVNGLFLPFDRRNAYNAATPKDDVSLVFAPAIDQTLTDLGLPASDPSHTVLTSFFVSQGDLLVLDTTTANTGSNAGAAYPNGRRVTDDVVDTILTLLNHGTTLTDSVNSNDATLPTTFPFLARPAQPHYDTNVDDHTRN